MVILAQNHDHHLPFSKNIPNMHLKQQQEYLLTAEFQSAVNGVRNYAKSKASPPSKGIKNRLFYNTNNNINNNNNNFEIRNEEESMIANLFDTNQISAYHKDDNNFEKNFQYSNFMIPSSAYYPESSSHMINGQTKPGNFDITNHVQLLNHHLTTHKDLALLPEDLCYLKFSNRAHITENCKSRGIFEEADDMALHHDDVVFDSKKASEQKKYFKKTKQITKDQASMLMTNHNSDLFYYKYMADHYPAVLQSIDADPNLNCYPNSRQSKYLSSGITKDKRRQSMYVINDDKYATPQLGAALNVPQTLYAKMASKRQAEAMASYAQLQQHSKRLSYYQIDGVKHNYGDVQPVEPCVKQFKSQQVERRSRLTSIKLIDPKQFRMPCSNDNYYPAGLGPNLPYSTNHQLPSFQEVFNVKKVNGGAPANDNNIKKDIQYVLDRSTKTTYLKGRLLGKGGFAKCYKMIDQESNRAYAAKVISKSQLSKQSHREQVYREIEIHKPLLHPNIVNLCSSFEDDYNMYIILEYCDNKTLVEIIKDYGILSEDETRYFMRQIISGVSYLHDLKILHRDLKLGNMFLTRNFALKVGDFGLSIKASDIVNKKISICGTPNYIAPEILAKTEHSYPSDIWAIGCIMYAMLCGKPPFESDSLPETYNRISRNIYTLPQNLSHTARELISKFLIAQSSRRIKLPVARKHSFFETEHYALPTIPADIEEQWNKGESNTEATNLNKIKRFSMPAFALGPVNFQQKIQSPKKRDVHKLSPNDYIHKQREYPGQELNYFQNPLHSNKDSKILMGQAILKIGPNKCENYSKPCIDNKMGRDVKRFSIAAMHYPNNKDILSNYENMGSLMEGIDVKQQVKKRPLSFAENHQILIKAFEETNQRLPGTELHRTKSYQQTSPTKDGSLLNRNLKCKILKWIGLSNIGISLKNKKTKNKKNEANNNKSISSASNNEFNAIRNNTSNSTTSNYNTGSGDSVLSNTNATKINGANKKVSYVKQKNLGPNTTKVCKNKKSSGSQEVAPKSTSYRFVNPDLFKSTQLSHNDMRQRSKSIMIPGMCEPIAPAASNNKNSRDTTKNPQTVTSKLKKRLSCVFLGSGGGGGGGGSNSSNGPSSTNRDNLLHDENFEAWNGWRNGNLNYSNDHIKNLPSYRQCNQLTATTASTIPARIAKTESLSTANLTINSSSSGIECNSPLSAGSAETSPINQTENYKTPIGSLNGTKKLKYLRQAIEYLIDQCEGQVLEINRSLDTRYHASRHTTTYNEGDKIDLASILDGTNMSRNKWIIQNTEDYPSVVEPGESYIWVTKWVDYAEKFGFGYQLSDGSQCVLYKDGSRLQVEADKATIFDNCDNVMLEIPDSQIHAIKTSHRTNVQQKLLEMVEGSNIREKISIYIHFSNFMEKNLIDDANYKRDKPSIPSPIRYGTCLKRRYVKHKKFGLYSEGTSEGARYETLVMRFNDDTLQINFLMDHIKIVLGMNPEPTYAQPNSNDHQQMSNGPNTPSIWFLVIDENRKHYAFNDVWNCGGIFYREGFTNPNIKCAIGKIKSYEAFKRKLNKLLQHIKEEIYRVQDAN